MFLRRFAITATVAACMFGFARPALADFSACESALATTDRRQQIDLYTICLNKGGIGLKDRAGAINNRGVAYRAIGDIDHALRDFNGSIDDDPRWGAAYFNRGEIYASRGQLALARADFDQAVRLPPYRMHGSAHLYRGRVRALLGDDAGAVEDFEAAIKSDHKLAGAFMWEALMLATSLDDRVRNGPKAVQLATQAVALWDVAFAHDVLAAADAEVGRFDEAKSEEARAIAMGGASPDRAARLALYQQGKPFHGRPTAAIADQP